MKKTTCLKLTAALLICLFFCGCQTGPTDEELINATMNSWKQAVIAQDVDAIMANYSEKFSSGDGGQTINDIKINKLEVYEMKSIWE